MQERGRERARLREEREPDERHRHQRHTEDHQPLDPGQEANDPPPLDFGFGDAAPLGRVVDPGEYRPSPTSLEPADAEAGQATDLSPLTDRSLVGKTIAGVLNIKEEPGKAIIDTLFENIREKSLLLFIDHCEHLIDTCAEIADKLLQSVKGIRILATSREALNIQGEVIWRIPSLLCPDNGSKKDIEAVKQYDAIKLFTDRAGSGRPGFTVNDQNVSHVVGICRRLDGIPLAIELAATRIRHLGPETILPRGLRHSFWQPSAPTGS